LGRALKRVRLKGGPKYRVIGVDLSPGILRRALGMRAIDSGILDPRKAVQEAEIVVLAAPPMACPRLLRDLWPCLGPGALVTDAAGVKKGIAEQARALRRLDLRAKPPVYIGSHPMAGSERKGLEHSREDLFKGAVCVLVQSGAKGSSSNLARGRLEGLWKDAGSRPAWMSAPEHDLCAAWTSHLPHVLASALCLALGSQASRYPKMKELAGPGFRDFTRLALSDPSLWSQVCRLNERPLRLACREFQKGLERFFRSGFSPRLFKSASAARRRLAP